MSQADTVVPSSTYSQNDSVIKPQADKLMPRALTTKQAAKYLCIAEATLRQGRCDGPREGHIPPPPHVKIGRKILYLITDLDAYLQSHRIDAKSADR